MYSRVRHASRVCAMEEYVAVEDESIRGIARRLGMRQTELVALNGHTHA